MVGKTPKGYYTFNYCYKSMGKYCKGNVSRGFFYFGVLIIILYLAVLQVFEVRFCFLLCCEYLLHVCF